MVSQIHRIASGDRRVYAIIYPVIKTCVAFGIDPRFPLVFLIEKGVLGDRVCDYYLHSGGTPAAMVEKMAREAGLSLRHLSPRNVGAWN